jgi:hypothetical protein
MLPLYCDNCYRKYFIFFSIYYTLQWVKLQKEHNGTSLAKLNYFRVVNF